MTMLRYQRLDKDGFKMDVEGMPVHGTRGLFATRQLGRQWILDHVPTGGKLGVFPRQDVASQVARLAFEMLGEDHLMSPDPEHFTRHPRYAELKELVVRREVGDSVEADG